MRKIIITMLIVILSTFLCCIVAYADEEFEGRYMSYPADRQSKVRQHHEFDIDEYSTVNLAGAAELKVTYYAEVDDDIYHWETSDNSIVEIVDSGLESNRPFVCVRGKSVGKATVSLIYDDYEMTVDFTVNVTDPDIREDLKDIKAIVYQDTKLKLIGTSTSPEDAVTINGKKCNAYLDDGYIRSFGEWSGSYMIYVDGRGIRCHAEFINVFLRSKNSTKSYSHSNKVDSGKPYGYMTYVVEGKQCRIVSVPDKKKLPFEVKHFTSTNKRIATVTKEGTFRAKKKGCTTIKCKVNGETVSTRIYVVSRKQMKVLKKLFKMSDQIEAGKLRYSTKKRMKKGYADCSLFVYRAAKAGGCTFGGNTGNKGQYEWCKKRKCIKGYADYTTEKPCDIIFFRSGGRKYGHVEMSVGYGVCIGIDGSRYSQHYINEFLEPVYIARPIK